MKKLLESMQEIDECGMDEAPMPAPTMAPPANDGDPVRMNVNLSAAGKEHVTDLIDMMKNAGIGNAEPDNKEQLPMRMDMERLKGIMGEPGDEDPNEELEPVDEIDTEEGYENEPDERFGDMSDAIPDGNDLNRKKKSYVKAQDGDNPMALENIKASLYAQLAEKKAKPDFLDMDKDGDTKEPMKKAAKDAGGSKGSKPKKGVVPPQFKKNVKEAEEGKMPSKAEVMKCCKEGMSKADCCKKFSDCDQTKLKEMYESCMSEMKAK